MKRKTLDPGLRRDEHCEVNSFLNVIPVQAGIQCLWLTEEPQMTSQGADPNHYQISPHPQSDLGKIRSLDLFSS